MACLSDENAEYITFTGQIQWCEICKFLGINFTVYYWLHFQRMNDLNPLNTDFNFVCSISHNIKLNSVPYKYIIEDRLVNPMLCKPYVITAKHLIKVVILFDGIIYHNPKGDWITNIHMRIQHTKQSYANNPIKWYRKIWKSLFEIIYVQL